MLNIPPPKYRYSAFSLVIHSQVELPQLPHGHGDPDVTIRIGIVNRAQREAAIDDELAFPRDVGGFHMMCGREIVVDLLPHADTCVVRDLLAGRMMGCLLRQRGYLPLHASAICIEGKGVVFMGESGAGKSTIAAAFHSRGHDVVADDISAVRTSESGIELLPAWPGLRLLQEGRGVIGAGERPSGLHGRKYVYHVDSPVFAGPYALKRMYLLDYETAAGAVAVRSSPLSKFSAVALLDTHSLLRTWRTGHTMRQINLDRCAAVADAQTVRRLVRPRSLKFLPDLVEFVEKDVAAGD
jgi:hypothetical protein